MSEKLKNRIDLLIGGVQIQNRKKGRGIGTLACVVFDNDSGKALGLSNKHILKRWVGTPVIQPALKKRTNHFIIGYLYKKSKTYDAAVFEINTSLRDYDRENSIHGLEGKITEIIEPYEGLKVQKVGQYTGITYGIVEKKLNKNKFSIVPNPDKPSKEISEGGDSGALWVTDEANFKAVGLHTSGEKKGSDKAWAIKISTVLEDLDIKF